MALLEKHLFIKTSGIPEAGKGLFTRQCIPKGTRIVEFKGRVTTWKKVLEGDSFNGYVFYINRNHVIDSKPYLKALARFANDAKGINKIKGILNKSIFIKDEVKVFILATKNIPAGGEILVSYEKEYWKVIRYNNRLALKEKKNNLKAEVCVL